MISFLYDDSFFIIFLEKKQNDNFLERNKKKYNYKK